MLLCGTTAITSCGSDDKPNANAGTAPAANSAKPAENKGGRGGSSFGDFAKKEAVKVDVYTLTPGRIAEYQVASGLLEAVDRAPVFSRVSELCIEVTVEEGDRVRAGDVLARVRDINFIAEHAKAQSEHAKSELRAKEAELKYLKDKGYYERIQRVVGDGKDERTYFNKDEIESARLNVETSKSTWDISQAEVTEAALQVEVALRNLQDCEICSPIDGIVVKRSVEPFDKINQDQEVFAIAQLDQLKVLVNVPEAASPSLSKKTPRRSRENAEMHAVLLKATAFPGERFLGYVHGIAPVIDSDRGMLPLETRIVPLPWVTAAANFEDTTSNVEIEALLKNANDVAGHMRELTGASTIDVAGVRNILTKIRESLDQFPPPVRRSILTSSSTIGPDGKARNLPELRPGMWIEASVVTKSNPAALVVPTTAVIKDSVFVIVEGPSTSDKVQVDRRPKAGSTEPKKSEGKPDVGGISGGKPGKPSLIVKRVDITNLLGISSEGYTELRKSADFREGVRVVWRGLDYLKDGDAVEIVGQSK